MADVDLKFSKPEARININRDKASIMSVSTRNIAQTLQYGLSGQRMGYFYMNGKQYEILGEINRQQRNKPADLKGIYIRSSQGDMVQLDNLDRTDRRHRSAQAIPLQPFCVRHYLCRACRWQDYRTRIGRNGQDSQRNAGRHLPQSSPATPKSIARVLPA